MNTNSLANLVQERFAGLNYQFKLPPDVKKNWVEALRSGSFQQGHGTLMRKDDKHTYCCLGVLHCVLKRSDPPNLGDLLSPHVGDYPAVTLCLLQPSGIGDIVAEAENVDDETPFVHPVEGLLALLNDDMSGDWTFQTIADWIEECL